MDKLPHWTQVVILSTTGSQAMHMTHITCKKLTATPTVRTLMQLTARSVGEVTKIEHWEKELIARTHAEQHRLQEEELVIKGYQARK